MQNPNLITTIASVAFTGEITISDLLFKGEIPFMLDSFEDENLVTTEEITFRDTRDIIQALFTLIGSVSQKVANHGADDDFYDNIPALMEQYGEFLNNLNNLYHNNQFKAESNFIQDNLKNALRVSQACFNALLKFQDPSESFSEEYLFAADIQELNFNL